MVTWKLTFRSDLINKVVDGKHTTYKEGTEGWIEYQEWLAAGNTPEPEFLAGEEDALAIEKFNNERFYKLQKCDWTQLPDVPQVTKDNWLSYRQELRDLPSQVGFDYKNPAWPVEPA